MKTPVGKPINLQNGRKKFKQNLQYDGPASKRWSYSSSIFMNFSFARFGTHLVWVTVGKHLFLQFVSCPSFHLLLVIPLSLPFPKESFLSFVFLLSSHWQFYLHTISFPKLSAVRCSWTYLTAINWAKSVISELTKNWQDAKTVQIDEICPHSKPFHCK